MKGYFIGAVALGTLAAAALLWMPGEPGGGTVPPPPQTYPWQVERLPDGATRVFGLALGSSTLADARRRLGPESGLELFVYGGKDRTLEAYFEQVSLGGLNAKVVLTLGLEPAELEAMAARSVESRGSASGAWRLTLDREGAERAAAAPILGIGYLPAAQLDEAVVEKLFGVPAEKTATDGDTTHWLYPEKGLDVTVHRKQKELLQYVHPARFDRLRAPLAAGPSPGTGPAGNTPAASGSTP